MRRGSSRETGIMIMIRNTRSNTHTRSDHTHGALTFERRTPRIFDQMAGSDLKDRKLKTMCRVHSSDVCRAQYHAMSQ